MMPMLNGIRRLARDFLLGPELRSSLENPSTPLSFPDEWLLDIFNGGRTDSGIRVSPMTALQASVVFACVDLIAGALASLPLNTYERLVIEQGGFKRHAKSLASDHPVFHLLEVEPNEEMSAFTFKKTLQAHILLWGNAYAELERDAGGRIVAIWPLNPALTRPVRDSKTHDLMFETSDGMRPRTLSSDVSVETPRRFLQGYEVIHIPGLSLDGRIGQNVVQLSRNAIGLTIGQEKYASKFFANGAAPLGALTTPNALKEEDINATRNAWQQAYGGENRHRTALLQNGITYTKIGSDASEAQMIEARKQQWLEICPIFHVNPAMFGLVRETGSSAEQTGLAFVNYTLGQWVTAWQDELRRKVFVKAAAGRNAGRTFFARFDVRGLTLPDAASKKEYYSAGKQWGFLNSDTILEMEGMNPTWDGSGQFYWMPVNMQVIKDVEPDADEQPGQKGQQDGDGDEPPADPKAAPKAGDAPPDPAKQPARMFYPAFRDAVGRAIAREKKDERGLRRIFAPAVRMLADYYDCEHRVDELTTSAISGSENWQMAEAEDVASRLVMKLTEICSTQD